MKTYICGNSHITSLAIGLKLLAYSGAQELKLFPLGNGAFEASPFSTISESLVKPSPSQYIAMLKRFTNLEFFDSNYRWGFVMGTHNARIYRDPFWINAEPAALAGPNARPVSDGVLSAMVERDQRFIRTFFLQLKTAGVHFFVVSCPFPRSDHDCLSLGIRRDVVGYIDQFARRQFSEWLTENDFDLIEPPPECRTEDGFLLPEYNARPLRDGAKDPHHANGLYGKLMMERVIAYLAKL